MNIELFIRPVIIYNHLLQIQIEPTQLTKSSFTWQVGHLLYAQPYVDNSLTYTYISIINIYNIYKL